jgi:glycine/serine hydroxymethyltransferase
MSVGISASNSSALCPISYFKDTTTNKVQQVNDSEALNQVSKWNFYTYYSYVRDSNIRVLFRRVKTSHVNIVATKVTNHLIYVNLSR